VRTIIVALDGSPFAEAALSLDLGNHGRVERCVAMQQHLGQLAAGAARSPDAPSVLFPRLDDSNADDAAIDREPARRRGATAESAYAPVLLCRIPPDVA
jgi:hypothetical protein